MTHTLKTIAWSTLFVVVVTGCSDDRSAPTEPGSPDEVVLGDLIVTGGRELSPAFSPQITRYSLLAGAAEGDDLTIEARFEAGLTVTRDGVALASGVGDSHTFAPGTTIELVVSDGATDRTYEIEYLPPDFPELSVTVPRDTPGGLTYLTIDTWLLILDDNAVPVFYRREEGRVFDFKRHSSGERSYAVRTGERNEYEQNMHEIVVLGPDFQPVDRVTTVGLNQTDLHDFVIRPDGNYVLIAYHGGTRDLTAEGGAADEVVVESVVQEIRRDRSVVFQWSSWDDIPLAEALREGPEYAHVNSVFLDDAGDFTVSARGVSQVLKVDRGTGDVAWKLGGMSNEFTFVDDPYPHLCGQHTASILPNGDLLVFDNGQLCWPEVPSRGEHTRVVEYALDVTGRTATLVWSYSEDGFYTRSQGSAQRLANGNTLIGWGAGPPMLATEVDPGGEKVWEIRGELDGNTAVSYRAFRSTESTVGAVAAGTDASARRGSPAPRLPDRDRRHLGLRGDE